MISFSRVSKQYGRQVLFVDASFQLNPGEKVGLVGPNGAGKTTLFRMIVGEESPDEGEVSVPRKLDDRLLPAGRRGDVGAVRCSTRRSRAAAGSATCTTSSRRCEHAMGDPERADEMDRILARFGEVQEEYEHLGGYELEARAREVLHGLGFDDEQIDGDVGALSGGWKMRVAMARVLLGRPDVLLMDEPTNHLDIESILWLEGFLEVVRRRLCFMTSHDRDFMNRVVTRIVEIDGGEITAYSGNYDFYERERAAARDEPRGGLRAAAGDARQGAALHRALLGPRRQGRAGAEPGQGAREDRDGSSRRRRARSCSSTSGSPPRSGDDVATLAGVTKATAGASSTTRSTSRSAAASAGA